MQNKEYSVLYTHQKTKKRKTWQDGILLFQKSNNKVILYDDQRTLLDSLFISNRQICCGMDLESDKYLITIEEEKNDTVATSHQANVNPRQALPRNYSLPSVRRKGFQPPKFTATEKRPHPGPDTTVGPPDKRFKLLIEDDGRQHIPSKPGIVTRDQFFSLYSQQRDQTTSIPRNFASHSVNDSNTIAKGNSRSLYTLKDKENTISECTFNNRSDCQSKRNSSQILALFSSNSNSTFQYSRQGMENYPTELTTDKPTFCGNPSEENKSTLQKTAPSLFNSFGNATKRVDALFESLCREKENNLVHKTGSHSLLTSFGNDDGLSEEKENELKQESIKHMISHLEPAKSAIGLIQEKENGLQEGPAPFFNSYHSNRNGLFNKSKSSYSTTPYLLELSTDNSTSQHDNNTHKPTLNKESYSVFPSQQGPGLDRHQASMWDGSSDMFQVPDIDYDMSDLSDSMGSDFYTHNMAGLDTTSRQSEQEKTDLMTSWKGSLTSDTVRRDSVVPATRLHGTSQFMAGSSASTLTTSEEDKFDLSGWEGNNTRQQGCSGGISQRVPKLKTRRRDPMTSCPTSSHITLYPEVETSSSSLNHHDSANKDFLNQSSPEEITPQFDAQSSFSSQSLSTNRFQVMPVETSSFQSKFSNQNRRVGLRKTGGSSSVGFLPGSKITSQRPSPVTVFNRSSLTDSNIIKETMMGELVFPSSKECDDNVKPCRQVTLPITFTSEQHYRHTMKAALREHLNIILFELAQSFHAGLRKVNISQYGSLDQDTHHDDRPRCSHGVATLRTVKKDGPNKGRLFYCCPGPTNSKCKLFKWANECKTQVASTNREQSQASRPTLSTTQEITSYFRTQNVSLYCECHLIIKKKTKKYGQDKYRYSKRNLADDGAVGPGKTVMYLELSRRETSTAYSKDDIWIVSSSLTFEKHSTFVAKSTYFGPYSSGELEISPISCYSPSKWQSGDVVFALHGYNAANELMCIDNIDDNVKSAYMPLLPRLLTKPDDSVSSTSRQHPTSTFVPPTRNASRSFDISADFAFALAEDTIKEYHLNMDQAAAMYDCANMFSTDDTGGNVEMDISLIHGVFGAGKSYLLAVMIVYLVKLFNTTEHNPKILVSSTTNVAVDRILLGLLDLGFEEFVRVGSVRKIAKKLLPFSMHGSGSSSEEIKELKAMLKEDIKPSEKMHIRKSIEQQRKGGNKQRLTGVPVVGVTCAASVFPCLEKTKFHVLLLDECSQMTEPAALLPLARFGCHKLVLVGDPKQLSPTIQGSQPDHDAGLEQTMFDRLVKMGCKTTLLRTQYRCHPVISAVANRLFYGGRLTNGVSEEDRAPLVEFAPTLCFYDVTKGKEKCGQDGSYYNEEEAKFIVFLIECFLESGLEPAQIGVITLYKSQLRTISSYITQSERASLKQLKSVQISTVDAFQGGEKDVILLSCVRTDHVGFIDCDRRTNVALTRAKRHLLIVGNQRMLSSNKMWSNVIQHCKGQEGGVVTASDFQQSWQDGTTVNKNGTHDNKAKPCDQAKSLMSKETYENRVMKEECETVSQAVFDNSDPVLVVDYTEINDSPLNDGGLVDRDECLLISDEEDFTLSKSRAINEENNDDDDTQVNDVIIMDELSDDGAGPGKDFNLSKPTPSKEKGYDNEELKEIIIGNESEELSLDEEFIHMSKSSENGKYAGISSKSSGKELSHDNIESSDEFKDSKVNTIHCDDGELDIMQDEMVDVLSDEQLTNSLNEEFILGKPLEDSKDNRKMDEVKNYKKPDTLSGKDQLGHCEKSTTNFSQTNPQFGNGDLQQSYYQAEENSLGICSEEFSCQTVKPGPCKSDATWNCSSKSMSTTSANFDLTTDNSMQACPGTGTKELGKKVFTVTDNFDSDEDDLPFFDIFSSMK